MIKRIGRTFAFTCTFTFTWTVALLTSGCASAPVAEAPAAVQEVQLRPAFNLGEVYKRLSEQAGYFDSDNLISNETSYLHALDDLRAMNVKGGAYIGVGPDQSFSYIAEIKPAIAVMIDIRRDAMLQHQIFRSQFSVAVLSSPDRSRTDIHPQPFSLQKRRMAARAERSCTQAPQSRVADRD